MTQMDVDKDEGGLKNVSVHPLAIVSMADHFTRVVAGGTPLAKNAPVVGIPFGIVGEDGSLQVTDAEDIPLQQQEAQVNLHQAVFPQHQVVGWYRASVSGEGPRPDDVPVTQQLQTQYPQHHMVFLHLQVSSTGTSFMAEGDKDDHDLPVTIFSFDGHAFVNLPHWSLATKDAERIAIERVVQEQPHDSKENAVVAKSKAARASLEAVQERVQVLRTYLQQPEPSPALLRRIQTLLCQLGPADTDSSASPDSLLELALLAKTVQHLQGYSENLRLGESGGRSSASAAMRRRRGSKGRGMETHA